MVKRLAIFKLVRQITLSFAGVFALASIYSWLYFGVHVLSISATVSVVILSIAGIWSHLNVIKIRVELNKKPREHRGHQDEPGSWQCSCGRYNGSYRSVCLTCGKKRPGLMD